MSVCRGVQNRHIGFLGFLENKNLMSDLSFYAFFTYYATHLIEMLSNIPINMNCIILRSGGRIFAVSSSYIYIYLWYSVNNRPVT